MSPPCTCTVTHSIGSLEGQDARLSSMGPWVCMSLSPYFLLWQQFYQTGSEGKPATRTKALPFYRFDFSNCAAFGDFGFLFAKKCCHQDRKWEKKWSPGYQWNPTPVLYFPHSHLNPEKKLWHEQGGSLHVQRCFKPARQQGMLFYFFPPLF